MRRILALAFVLAACGGDDSNNPKPDAPTNPQIDAGVVQPDGNDTTTVTQCEDLPAVTTGTCGVTAGGTTTLLKGNVLTASVIYKGGQVLVDATGIIQCVGCNCGTGGETVISCPDASISPGLINTHDHITFTQDPPYTDSGERYESRQQWRLGLDGHKKIPAPGGATGAQVSWGELRFLMGGATSIVGSGGSAGLLRNLDKNLQEGLTKTPVKFDTFPLGDSSGTRVTGTCNYGANGTTAASLSSVQSYEPHTSEGIDAYAHNEFLCESSMTYDVTAPGISQDLAIAKTAMIHAVGLTAEDYGLMAANHTSLIWSPRSNITLYGDTARVSTAARLGVQIALGTDWLPSGSMNMLRELTCADGFNKTYLNSYFTDEQLWAMVTGNAANVVAMSDVIGSLTKGKQADISIFAAHGKAPFRAVLEAKAPDVAMVMRGGKILYGDNASFGPQLTTCDAVDVCGTMKSICLMSEVNMTYDGLNTAAKNIYPAFQCDVPMNEPSCSPKRPTSVSSSTIYTGTPSADDTDGDGVPNATDNCPTVFNPIRPMDMGKQNDTDNDGVGDECDPCPRDANTTTCTSFDPNDSDGDGVPNDTDNCPNVANHDQMDMDSDGHGDACDACPMVANPGAAACPATIYQVKTNSLPLLSTVQISNVLVTGVGTNGFFVQAKTGDTGYNGVNNSGLFVFTGAASPFLGIAVAGARVTIQGSVDSFQGELELDSVTSVVRVGTTTETLPDPVTVGFADVKTGGGMAAALEGVIVKLPASTISAVTAPEYTLSNGTDSLVVSNFIYATPSPTVGQAVQGMTGILAFRNSADKILPRSAADVNLGPPVLASFGPALSYIRQGIPGNTFPAGSELTVTLTGPAQGATTITVTSMNANITVVGPVVVPDGATSVKVALNATAAVTDGVILAQLGTAMLTAHVRALGTAEVPSTVTLTPATTVVAPGGTRTFTVTLDLPAPTLGTTVTLAASAGNVPGTVTVAPNALAGTFTYTAPTSGPTTVTATLGSSTSTATITIGINHLIINEVDNDQPGTDTAEYVEIYNPGADQDLTGISLVLVNGSNNTIYDTIDLTSAGTLPAGGYLVVGGAGVTVAAGALKVDPGWTSNAVQNGPPDGLALINTNGPVLLDALSYANNGGAGITSVNITGFPAPVSLVEGGMPATAVDSATVAGALCRSPNGSDTDVANTDWKFCATPTPGAANTL